MEDEKNESAKTFKEHLGNSYTDSIFLEPITVSRSRTGT